MPGDLERRPVVVPVGDNYRQDIGMGKKAGTQTVLVLTGATWEGDVAGACGEPEQSAGT